MGVEIKSLGNPPVSALAIGSVGDVIQGRIRPELCKARFKAKDYFCGFESGSPRGISSIGESVLLNGMCYATSTDTGSPDYDRVISGPEFVTGGMFLLNKGARPTYELVLKRKMELKELFQKIYEAVQRPVAFAGSWENGTLYTMQIGKPPIDGLPLFENRDYYFPKPHETLHNTHCFVIGIIASFNDERWKNLHQQLETVLYRNLDDKQEASLSSHAHCLVLKREVSPGKIDPESVDRCLHVFVDQTTVKKAHLNLYAIDRVDRFIKI